ncbi:hypothetical protein [Methylovulum miyakonense]|uniref:hypothetical protein n=1 Tax=Methylovulum miyakonense TaxID=645578 RepID=UPI0003618965|nr:hypothetical protein [Methylovulum miyakonense]
MQENYDDEYIAEAQGIINKLRDVESQFEFTVTISGTGTTPEEAYLAAVEALSEDPGEPQLAVAIWD